SPSRPLPFTPTRGRSMSVHDRLTAAAVADLLNPKWVTRHRGAYHEFLDRHRVQVKEALVQGRLALQELARHLLDPRSDDRTLGFRPGKGRLHALLLAEQLLAGEQRGVWVTEDVRDAFHNVPLSRLLQVVRKYAMADDLAAFIGTVLGGASTPG